MNCSIGKVLILLLGQLYVGPNSLWAPFVTVIVQLMYCLVLYSGFSGMDSPQYLGAVCPTTIYMLKSPLVTSRIWHVLTHVL